ncbi:MAG: class I SAM-dependent methyltransferase [Planctomycetota bacterium]
MSSSIPPGYGYLEHCNEAEGDLVIGGWFLLLDGPFDRCEVILPDGSRSPATSKQRPDLTENLDFIPGAERGSFVCRVPLPELGPDDTLELTIVGVLEGQDVAKMDFGYHRPPKEQVFPPSDVMIRATGSDNHEFYRATGIKACNDFRRYLRGHIDLAAVRNLMEWGCGAGRLSRHLIDRFKGARFFGTDIDKEAVQWAAANLKGEFIPCGLSPPLDYQDGQFDLVVSLSVFTHLTKRFQDLWLAEIRRVLEPGGVFLATTHGAFAGRWTFHQPGEFEEVFKTGFYDGLEDTNLGKVAGGDYYRSTFQTYEYTREYWSKTFEILDYIEGGMNNLQDVYILRKPRG